MSARNLGPVFSAAAVVLLCIAFVIHASKHRDPPACEGVLDRDEIPADAYPEPVERAP